MILKTYVDLHLSQLILLSWTFSRAVTPTNFSFQAIAPQSMLTLRMSYMSIEVSKSVLPGWLLSSHETKCSPQCLYVLRSAFLPRGEDRREVCLSSISSLEVSFRRRLLCYQRTLASFFIKDSSNTESSLRSLNSLFALTSFENRLLFIFNFFYNSNYMNVRSAGINNSTTTNISVAAKEITTNMLNFREKILGLNPEHSWLDQRTRGKWRSSRLAEMIPMSTKHVCTSTY